MMDAVDPMEEIRASFFVECEELLEALQDGLQTISDGESDVETINVVFRAVHSIKGGAGAFGLEDLVRFAHCFETVMDALRSGSLENSSEITNLFFRCADHLSDLIVCSRDNRDLPTSKSEALIADLSATTGVISQDQNEPEDIIEFEPMVLQIDLGMDVADEPEEKHDDTPVFEIHFAPFLELYKTGNEPFFLLQALQDLGSCQTCCNLENIDPLSDDTPNVPALSWDIVFKGTADESDIHNVFEFVEGLCELTIKDISYPETDEILPEIPDLPELPPLDDLPELPDLDELPKLDLAPQNEAPVVTKEPAPKSPPQAAAPPKSVVRVDIERIERLVNLVGELVINQSMLSQSLGQAGLSPHSEAMNSLDDFQRLTRDIQDSVMMIRAQPVKPLFQRMSRIVRESSASVGKDVRLNTIGEGTEVDKTVIERLADPLTHMIRNAVDHGLETAEVRAQSGKPNQGCITLSAAHKSGRVIIEVTDDGAGINRERVRQTAIDKGLIDANLTLTDNEIDSLLFMPGFSTVSEITDLSGRGVGMDVVRNAIQSLGGRITITSTPGLGTVFSISLPLTLAVLDGMIVSVANETLVLPLSVVSETLTLTDTNLDTISNGLDVIRIRDSFIPLHDLGVALGYRTQKDDYLEAVAMVIDLDEGNQAALIVDEILDQRQVVIKGLDDGFYRAPGIAAATILGDGRIALIIDPPDVITATRHYLDKKSEVKDRIDDT